MHLGDIDKAQFFFFFFDKWDHPIDIVRQITESICAVPTWAQHDPWQSVLLLCSPSLGGCRGRHGVCRSWVLYKSNTK